MKNLTASVQECKASGEVVHAWNYQNEDMAQWKFDKKEKELNVSEWDDAGTVGYLRLVVEIDGMHYLRRELYIKA